uniref:MRG domain-containing protein n=1 Tax=Chrysotila carterae TaxID=13221 RepID=A0A7S4F0T1_CHRCT|mmetsp:Transcript_26977/g.56684  ORF Transcript_26977/g.56684 Transcript_26977/m.56684 type:complete len:304 (+) Transcript_26977:108-1019(+)
MTEEQPRKVLAYHGPLLYEAEVLDTQDHVAPNDGKSVKMVRLRYDCFSSHWDEWVPVSLTLELNEKNLQLQKDRLKEFNRTAKRRASKADSEQVAGAAAAVGEDKASGKRKLGTDNPKDGKAPKSDESRDTLKIPHHLKLRLIEDWERTTREHKLLPLPRNPNVSSILQEFIGSKCKRNSQNERLYMEICDGVRSYFNQALRPLLLYKYEEKQYGDIMASYAPNVPEAVEIYGAEHMLRLFVKLPEILSHCKLKHEQAIVLNTKVVELLKFMVPNRHKFFTTNFIAPNDEYAQWWGTVDSACK